MNKRQPQKTPHRGSAKRHKPGATLSAPPPVTAREARARQKELDQLHAHALQACRDQWAYCHDNPYDTAAFVAYEKLNAGHWDALRAADPERYALEQPRRREIEAAEPPGFHQAMEQLRIGDAKALEIPVRFLEMDPWTHGSGYAKEWVIQYINRLDIPPAYVRRLQNVVLSVIDKADGRREFRSYCRLARKVDSAEFRQELENRLTVSTARIGQRAQWALNACRNK